MRHSSVSIGRTCARALAVVLGLASGSSAQPASVSPDARAQSGRPPRVEVSALALAATGAALGSSRATLLGNAVPSGSPVTLLDANTRISTAPVAEARVGVRLAGGLVAEAGVSYARPELRVQLTNDIEGAPDVTATTRLTQLVVDGALVHRWRAGRWAPFVLGGAGYLRQLDDPRTTVETGQVFMAGGGLLYGLGRPRARGGHRLMLRGDVRLVAYRGGLVIEDDRPFGLVAGGGLTVALW